jgi:cobalt/nickel transport system ATP-binding protein
MVFQDPDDQIFFDDCERRCQFWAVEYGFITCASQRKGGFGASSSQSRTSCRESTLSSQLRTKERVAIAGVLAMSPEVIVLDEPFAYLDPQGKKGLIQILQQLSAEGKTVIIATHDVDLAAEWADRIVIIQGGKVLD